MSSPRTLAELLGRPDSARTITENQALQLACSHPACGGPALDPHTSGTLLLAERNGLGSLWSLETGPVGAEGAGRRPFVGDGLSALHRADLVARQSLPLHGGQATTVHRFASLIANDDRTLPEVLTGTSFGLSMVLDSWSRSLRMPVQAHVAATAAITPEGALLAVDGIEAKVTALHHWALNVTHLLVAADTSVRDNKAEAERVAAKLGMKLEVIALSWVEQAWDFAFPGVHNLLRERWGADPRALERACRRFFELALVGRNDRASWAAVAAAAEILRELTAQASGKDTPSTSELHWRADVAHKIASRHWGKPLRIDPDSPYAAELPSDKQALLWAHVIQSWTDAPESGQKENLSRVDQLVLSDRPEGLKVLGARGRLYGAHGEWSQSAEDCRRAVKGWVKRDEFDQASYPLCEWLRIAGVTRDRTLLDEALLYVEDVLGALETEPQSYVWLAIGRSWSQLGERGRAIEWLAGSGLEWSAAPPPVQASRLRWLVRTDAARAPEFLSELDVLVERKPDLTKFRLLAGVDAGEPGAFDRLAAIQGLEIARLRDAAPGGDERRLAEMFRY